MRSYLQDHPAWRVLSKDPHLFAALALLAVHLAYFFGWTLDDPYISYRYAQNLAAGHGLVFNVGERVEGYSNFSYVLILALAALARVGLPDFSPCFGYLCSLATLLVVWAGIRGRQKTDAHVAPIGSLAAAAEGLVARVGLYLLALSGPFAMWGVGGLETPFYALVGTAALLVCAREMEASPEPLGPRWCPWLWSALLCALAAMTRPEGVIYFAVCIAAKLVWLLRKPSSSSSPFFSFSSSSSSSSSSNMPSAWFRLATWLAVSLGLLAAYTAWRVWYFGELLPNTYYAKATGALGSRLFKGGAYALRSLELSGGALPVFALFYGAVTAMRGDALRLLATGACFAHLAFMTWAGGDWMPVGRFMAPAAPALAWLAQDAIVWLWKSVSRRALPAARVWLARGAVGLAVAACLAAALVTERFDSFDYVYALRTNSLHQQYIVVGQWLKAHAAAGDRLASEEAGIVPYYSGLQFIDMLGLVDRHIARMEGGLFEKYDAQYVLDRQPRFIFLQCLWPIEPGARPQAHDPGGRELFAKEEFHQLYAIRKVWTRGNARRSNPMVLFERLPGAQLDATG